jgi:alkylhydroperoxidase family enzyme
MPRIPLLNERQVGWFTRVAYGLARRRFGQVPEPFQAAANHRRLMWAGGVHELLVERGARRLDPELRDFVVHRVATRVGCSWCVDFGTTLALKAAKLASGSGRWSREARERIG